MGAMNRLSLAVEEQCSLCQESKCEGCKMRCDIGDRIVYVNGKTREIIGSEKKSELAKTGAFILSCMKVAVLLFIMSLDAYGETLGECSYYNTASCQREGTSGVWTASGERFEDAGLTCAMRSRDFGKYYRVTIIKSGKSVIVKHNDFGPSLRLWKRGRVIDLSEGAFRKIADVRVGIIQVKIEEVAK